MFGAASALTVITLTGLAAGFAREWLLVAGWGAGGRTDAFLVAMFLPEALRTVLAGGVLSSAGLAMWPERSHPLRAAWLSGTTASMGLIGCALAILLSFGAPLWIGVIGPGLSAGQHQSGVEALQLLAWSLPGIVLQAWWSVALQSEGRFLLPGFGSLLFNLPAIAYMMATRGSATEQGLALGFVSGSVLMTLPMVPPVMRLGLVAKLMRPRWAPMRELGLRLMPLATSAGVSQGLLLLERVVASYLGEGSLTVINLARKLVNVPLVALMSLNQVLLGLMSRQSGSERLDLLKRGLATVTIVSLPAAMGLILASDGIVSLLFRSVPGNGRLEPLLAWYAVTVAFAGWNAMIARFSYAAGDTRQPLICELAGSCFQAVCLPVLAWELNTPGVAVAMLAGTLLTGVFLVWRQRLWGRLDLAPQGVVSAAALGLAGAAMPFIAHRSPVAQLSIAALTSALCACLLAGWLRPWRPAGQVLMSPRSTARTS